MQLALPVNHGVADWHPDSPICQRMMENNMSTRDILKVLSSLSAYESKLIAEQQKVLVEQQKVLVEQRQADILEHKLKEANMKLLVEKGRVNLRNIRNAEQSQHLGWPQ